MFPDAHKAARKIVVLQSQQDGILGPPPSEAKNFWEALWESPDHVRDIFSADDMLDATLGTLGGAYSKKWWAFPVGLSGPITDYYTGKAPANTVRPTPLSSDPYSRIHDARRAGSAWAVFRDQAIQEAREAIASADPLPIYDLLAPLAHHAVVSEERAANYIDSLQRLVQRNWWADKSPRAALGSIGFDEVRYESLFIENLLRNKIFDFVDQTPWLFDHSGMKIPSDEVFEKSYQEGIMQPLLLNSGFGGYGQI